MPTKAISHTCPFSKIRSGTSGTTHQPPACLAVAQSSCLPQRPAGPCKGSQRSGRHHPANTARNARAQAECLELGRHTGAQHSSCEGPGLRAQARRRASNACTRTHIPTGRHGVFKHLGRQLGLLSLRLCLCTPAGAVLACLPAAGAHLTVIPCLCAQQQHTCKRMGL